MTAPQTIQQWVEQASTAMTDAGLFFGHGTDNAYDEACWMVSHVLALAPDFDPSLFSRTLTSNEASKLNALLEERITTQKPLAYLISTAWFAGLSFLVTDEVLVPRSPLAELVLDNGLPWFDMGQAKRVLEIGTGSGCIACAIAHHWPHIEVDATDISEAALALAKDNVGRLGLDDRVQVFASDVFSSVAFGQYDVIFSNPPYVPEASMAALPTEYLHEPSLGLVAGPEGLDVVTRLVTDADRHLTAEGVLVCEVGEAWPFFDRWAEERRLEITWLELTHGGEGVFLATKQALEAQLRAPNEHVQGGTISN